MQQFLDFFNYNFNFGSSISFSVKSLLVILIVFVSTRYFLKLLRRLVQRTLSKQAQFTFQSIFSFFNYFVYVIVTLITFDVFGKEHGVGVRSASVKIYSKVTIHDFLKLSAQGLTFSFK